MVRRIKSIADQASNGGKARAASLTPEQRSESARKAVRARWAKVRSGSSFTVTVGIAQKGSASSVEIVRIYHDYPVVLLNDAMHTVNLHSPVITLKSSGETFTR